MNVCEGVCVSVYPNQIMAYQLKLAEKLVVLNERGRGVLIRMNHIKKVRNIQILFKKYDENRRKMFLPFYQRPRKQEHVGSHTASQ